MIENILLTGKLEMQLKESNLISGRIWLVTVVGF